MHWKKTPLKVKKERMMREQVEPLALSTFTHRNFVVNKLNFQPLVE